MTNGFDELRALGDEAADYARLRWAELRLVAAERLSQGASRALGKGLGVAATLMAALFVAIAAALWIGESTGRPLWGFLIVGGALLLVGVALFAFGRRMFSGAMVRFFVKLLFTDNDYRHGMRK